MELRGLHILLTYQCNYECDHCFVWGGPWQPGTLTMESLDRILAQARGISTCEWIYFEGGEPFLFYPILLHGVETAKELGFKVGLVSNGYWATGEWDALEWLRPFKGLLDDLSVSNDGYHAGQQSDQQAKFAEMAAVQLRIPMSQIAVAQPEERDAPGSKGQLPEGECRVMYRGRAAEKLAPDAPKTPWQDFTECPHEDLKEPGRVHLDPTGNLHVCQGISIGNVFRTPLHQILDRYEVDGHPIAGPIFLAGPAELVRRYDVSVEDGYADACHLCYKVREALKPDHPEVLVPEQMYGDVQTV